MTNKEKFKEVFGKELDESLKFDTSFEVTGDMLETVTIEEDSWWELKFINDDHVLLCGNDNHELRLKRDFLDSNFESFIYNK